MAGVSDKMALIIAKMKGKAEGKGDAEGESYQHPAHEAVKPHIQDFINAVHASDHEAATDAFCHACDCYGEPAEEDHADGE